MFDNPSHSITMLTAPDKTNRDLINNHRLRDMNGLLMFWCFQIFYINVTWFYFCLLLTIFFLSIFSYEEIKRKCSTKEEIIQAQGILITVNGQSDSAEQRSSLVQDRSTSEGDSLIQESLDADCWRQPGGGVVRQPAAIVENDNLAIWPEGM